MHLNRSACLRPRWMGTPQVLFACLRQLRRTFSGHLFDFSSLVSSSAGGGCPWGTQKGVTAISHPHLLFFYLSQVDYSVKHLLGGRRGWSPEHKKKKKKLAVSYARCSVIVFLLSHNVTHLGKSVQSQRPSEKRFSRLCLSTFDCTSAFTCNKPCSLAHTRTRTCAVAWRGGVS